MEGCFMILSSSIIECNSFHYSSFHIVWILYCGINGTLLTVIVPLSTGNFSMPCTLKGTTCNCHRPVLPKSMLYGDGALFYEELCQDFFFKPFLHSSNVKGSGVFPSGHIDCHAKPITLDVAGLTNAFTFLRRQSMKC